MFKVGDYIRHKNIRHDNFIREIIEITEKGIIYKLTKPDGEIEKHTWHQDSHSPFILDREYIFNKEMKEIIAGEE